MPRKNLPVEVVAPIATLHPPPPPSPLVQKLRTDWRWAGISQFLWTFSDAFGLVDWDIEALEADMDGDETVLVPDIIAKSLYALTYNRQINRHNAFEHLHKQYVKRSLTQPILGTEDQPVEWATLGLSVKVEVLWTLCEWQMDDPARFRALLKSEEEAASWRIDPLGWDKEGNTYYLFDDNRLWVQHLPPPPPRPPKKTSMKAKRALKRSRQSHPAADGTGDSPAPRKSHKRKERPPASPELTPPPPQIEDEPVVSGPRKRTQVAFYGNPTPTVQALKRGGPLVTPAGATPSSSKVTRSNSRLLGSLAPAPAASETPSRPSSSKLSHPPPASLSTGTRVSRRLRGGEEEEWQQIPPEWLASETSTSEATTLVTSRATRSRPSGISITASASTPVSKGNKRKRSRRDADAESDLSALTDEEEHQAMLDKVQLSNTPVKPSSGPESNGLRMTRSGKLISSPTQPLAEVRTDHGKAKSRSRGKEKDQEGDGLDGSVGEAQAVSGDAETKLDSAAERQTDKVIGAVDADSASPLTSPGPSTATASRIGQTSDSSTSNAKPVELDPTAIADASVVDAPIIGSTAARPSGSSPALAAVSDDAPVVDTNAMDVDRQEGSVVSAEPDRGNGITAETSAPANVESGTEGVGDTAMNGDDYPDRDELQEVKPDAAEAMGRGIGGQTSGLDSNGLAPSEVETKVESAVPVEEEEEETDEVKLAAKEAKNLPEGFVEWEAVCVTLYDWRTFPERFASSRHPDEKNFYRTLTQEVGPKIIEVLVAKEQERIKQEAINNRKRSSRIATKELEREEILRRELAQREMEERMERMRREEAAKVKEEAELVARERAREDRLREREERMAAREEAVVQRMMREQMEKEEAIRKRESRLRRRERGEILGSSDEEEGSARGSRVATPRTGEAGGRKVQQVVVEEKEKEEGWELACEICRKTGWNLDDDSDVVSCDDCGRWQHVECHDRQDAVEGKPKRNWDKVDFQCKDCRRKAARRRQRLSDEARPGVQPANGHAASLVKKANGEQGHGRQSGAFPSSHHAQSARSSGASHHRVPQGIPPGRTSANFIEYQPQPLLPPQRGPRPPSAQSSHIPSPLATQAQPSGPLHQQGPPTHYPPYPSQAPHHPYAQHLTPYANGQYPPDRYRPAPGQSYPGYPPHPQQMPPQQYSPNPQHPHQSHQARQPFPTQHHPAGPPQYQQGSYAARPDQHGLATLPHQQPYPPQYQNGHPSMPGPRPGMIPHGPAHPFGPPAAQQLMYGYSTHRPPHVAHAGGHQPQQPYPSHASGHAQHLSESRLDTQRSVNGLGTPQHPPPQAAHSARHAQPSPDMPRESAASTAGVPRPTVDQVDQNVTPSALPLNRETSSTVPQSAAAVQPLRADTPPAVATSLPLKSPRPELLAPRNGGAPPTPGNPTQADGPAPAPSTQPHVAALPEAMPPANTQAPAQALPAASPSPALKVSAPEVTSQAHSAPAVEPGHTEPPVTNPSAA